MLASALLPIALSDLESIKEKLKKACEVVDSLLFVALVSETAVEIQSNEFIEAFGKVFSASAEVPQIRSSFNSAESGVGVLCVAGNQDLLKAPKVDVILDVINDCDNKEISTQFLPGCTPTIKLSTLSKKTIQISQLPCIAFGGTFDRLHSGHLLMMCSAALLAERRVVCGIAGDKLLGLKKHGGLIKGIEEREKTVVDILTSLRPDLNVEMVRLKDALGPTATDDDIQGLIVSNETLGGGELINIQRDQAKLQPLSIFSIPFMLSQSGQKLSSSQLRADEVPSMKRSPSVQAALQGRADEMKRRKEKEGSSE